MLIPTVGKKPVVGAILITVTHQLDGVETNKVAANMMIDTRSVNEEVLINSNDGLTRTIESKLSLQILLTTDRVGTSTLVLVIIPGFAVLASAVASRSGTIAAGARIGAARDVVIARREAVRRAFLSDNTSLNPVVISRVGRATIAATSIRASKHIFRGKDDITALLDADTIADGADSTESPAGTAPSLITDHAHRLAVGILLTRIIGFRSTQLQIFTVTNTLKTIMECLGISDTKKLCKDILKAHPSNRTIQRSTPQLCLAVHTTNKVHSAHTTIRY